MGKNYIDTLKKNTQNTKKNKIFWQKIKSTHKNQLNNFLWLKEKENWIFIYMYDW
jgi:hypothetical protein